MIASKENIDNMNLFLKRYEDCKLLEKQRKKHRRSNK
jgi:hypothetical protein